MDLVLIDGPNIFNAVGARIASELPERNRELRDYMADWFDFHRLVQLTLRELRPPTLGNVVFHSARQLGKGPYKLGPEQARDFWTRQGANLSTSCYDVNIPGDERSTYVGVCNHCERECILYQQGEKGVDNAMTVYMFESAARWERLCIFSHDVDFVPAVWALRRRGKQVYVASDPDATKSALVRAAQSLLSIPWEAVLNDFGSYVLLRAGGMLDDWIARVTPALNVGIMLTNGGAEIFVCAKGKDADTSLRALAVELNPLEKCHIVTPPEPAATALRLRTSLVGEFYPPAKWVGMRITDMRQISEPASTDAD